MPTAGTDPIDVHDVADRNRYEITVGDTVAGHASYRLVEGGRVFDHTVIESAFEGRGIGSALARGALQDVIDRGIPMAATCPFLVSYLERHPELAGQVDPSLLD